VKIECVLTCLSDPRCWRGLSCEVRNFRCRMFTVRVAYKNAVSRGESIQLGWLLGG
jgi:hypothetical protein